MPGFIPGPLGFAAFASAKFGGYVLAGVALKKLHPAITASAVKIAAARTGLGILLGPVVTVAAIAIVEHFSSPANGDSSLLPLYPFLFALRVLIWALVIFLFARRSGLAESKFWAYASLGALWSCLLDLPGLGLALISPGRIAIC
jgi:hypothetical protein